MLITNARLPKHDGLWDISIEGTRISSISESSSQTPRDPQVGDENTPSPQVEFSGERIDAAGRLVAPQFIEAHVHLDYANTNGIPRPNHSGTLFEAIEIWGERKDGGLHKQETIYNNAKQAALSAMSHGVGYIRTHVDVTDPTFAGLDALVQLREDLKDQVYIELVAFPQNGMYAYEGGAALVEQALERGASVVGGIPHLEPTRELGVQSVKHAFDLAEKFGARVDIHCDEIDDPQSRFVEVMAAETTQRSMQEHANVSHAVAMSYYNPGYMQRLLPKLRESQVTFAVCPNENLHLQGRGWQNPVPRGVAPVRELTEQMIPVAFCQDSMADPFYPLGNGDLMRIVDTGLHVSHMLTPQHMDSCLDFITTNPAYNLGITDHYGIEPGKDASLVIIDAATQQEVLRQGSTIVYSMHKGREIFRAKPAEVTWA
ncbi:amidohydrolase family protein [Corynebacterium pilosum]|uniref:Creatinine deaminase n=1 Tax=Corynebacterium pilosum TaxID=35756 RepID=A0A376CJM4_9CORY|nr:amidohydrolase family protein [Corynebacterium pilosum]STC68515.1 creatinine deaminase [Corynebacterium pilosum]